MWRHLAAKFHTNASGATWWLNFQQMHVAPLAMFYYIILFKAPCWLFRLPLKQSFATPAWWWVLRVGFSDGLPLYWRLLIRSPFRCVPQFDGTTGDPYGLFWCWFHPGLSDMLQLCWRLSSLPSLALCSPSARLHSQAASMTQQAHIATNMIMI